MWFYEIVKETKTLETKNEGEWKHVWMFVSNFELEKRRVFQIARHAAGCACTSCSMSVGPVMFCSKEISMLPDDSCTYGLQTIRGVAVVQLTLHSPVSIEVVRR